MPATLNRLQYSHSFYFTNCFTAFQGRKAHHSGSNCLETFEGEEMNGVVNLAWLHCVWSLKHMCSGDHTQLYYKPYSLHVCETELCHEIQRLTVQFTSTTAMYLSSNGLVLSAYHFSYDRRLCEGSWMSEPPYITAAWLWFSSLCPPP